MPSQTELQEKVDQRVALVENAGKFLKECEEAGEVTAEQHAKWEQMHTDADALKGEIDGIIAAQEEQAARVTRQQEAEAQLKEIQTSPALENLRRNGLGSAGPGGDPRQQPVSRAVAIDTVVNAWSKGGRAAFDRGDADLAAAFKASGCGWDSEQGGLYINLCNQAPNSVADIVAALSTQTGSAGGNTIPQGFLPNLERALLKFGGMRREATVIRTDKGNDLPMPDMDDTSNTGAQIGENTQDGEQDLTFGVTTLGAHEYTSRIVRVPKALEQDSAFSMGAEIGSACGTRLGRIENTHATVGTGSGQPNGIVTASTLGKTAAGATAVTHDELLDLKHSIDPAYREADQASWMFNDSTLLNLKKLKDSEGRPLWQAGITVGAPDRIDGDRYTINQDMASMASAGKSILYGCLAKFYIREVQGVTLVRLVERYADFNQVAYVAHMRFDSDLRDAGTNPVKYLQQA